MRKASGLQPPYRDGRFTRQSVQRAATESPHEPFDTSEYKTVQLPATAARGAGKMAPRSRYQNKNKVQTVGVASERTKYELPVRVTQDLPDVHPFDRPGKQPRKRSKAG
jgi:hypothetical protein